MAGIYGDWEPRLKRIAPPNLEILQGNITLDGTAQQLSTDEECRVVTIQANPNNAEFVYVGNEDVSDTVHMAVLGAGSSVTYTIDNLNKLYVFGTIADTVSYGGEA
jgi:hypothetical protein